MPHDRIDEMSNEECRRLLREFANAVRTGEERGEFDSVQNQILLKAVAPTPLQCLRGYLKSSGWQFGTSSLVNKCLTIHCVNGNEFFSHPDWK